MDEIEKSKPTPGPWESDGPNWYGDFNIIPLNEGLAIGAVVRNGMRDQRETKANAILCASAPKLLAALKDSLILLKSFKRQMRIVDSAVKTPDGRTVSLTFLEDEADAAIAEAEGR